MKVKIFDFEHEKDLEKAINDFLRNPIEVVKIDYQMCHFHDNIEQIYSFSAMIVYNENKKG